MKDKIIVIKNNIIFVILLIAIIFFALSLIYKHSIKQTIAVVKIENTDIPETELKENKQPTRVLPEDLDGYKIIGKLEIPKINLETYILNDTNDKTLSKSVTKLCGPKINEMGNFCILGHNYNKTNMFGNLRKVKIGDKIILTNIYGFKLEYKVYDIYKVYPNETECLSQECEGNRDVTLITCTAGAIKRLVVKATEIYD